MSMHSHLNCLTLLYFIAASVAYDSPPQVAALSNDSPTSAVNENQMEGTTASIVSDGPNRVKDFKVLLIGDSVDREMVAGWCAEEKEAGRVNQWATGELKPWCPADDPSDHKGDWNACATKNVHIASAFFFGVSPTGPYAAGNAEHHNCQGTPKNTEDRIAAISERYMRAFGAHPNLIVVQSALWDVQRVANNIVNGNTVDSMLEAVCGNSFSEQWKSNATNVLIGGIRRNFPKSTRLAWHTTNPSKAKFGQPVDPNAEKDHHAMDYAFFHPEVYHRMALLAKEVASQNDMDFVDVRQLFAGKENQEFLQDALHPNQKAGRYMISYILQKLGFSSLIHLDNDGWFPEPKDLIDTCLANSMQGLMDSQRSPSEHANSMQGLEDNPSKDLQAGEIN